MEKMKESSTGNEEDSGAEVNSYHSQTVSAKISPLTSTLQDICWELSLTIQSSIQSAHERRIQSLLKRLPHEAHCAVP